MEILLESHRASHTHHWRIQRAFPQVEELARGGENDDLSACTSSLHGYLKSVVNGERPELESLLKWDTKMRRVDEDGLTYHGSGLTVSAFFPDLFEE